MAIRELVLSNGAIALVDEQDFETVNRWKWRQHKDGYAYRSARKSDGAKGWTNVYLHRLLMNPPKGMEVDHLDRNPLNNTRSNLRVVEHFENRHNSPTRPNQSSGQRGVSQPKGRRKWAASIRVKGRYHWLGSHDTKEQAQKAYQAAVEQFGLIQPATNWPTADANTATYSNHHGGYQNLREVAANWPTPRRTDEHGPGEHGEGGGDLRTTAALWQTPATDSFRSRGGERKDEQGLDQQARMWQTDQVLSHPGQTTEKDGSESFESGQTSRRQLNPAFVIWLMGWPDGWLDLAERSNSGSQATESCRKPPSTPSGYSESGS